MFNSLVSFSQPYLGVFKQAQRSAEHSGNILRMFDLASSINGLQGKAMLIMGPIFFLVALIYSTIDLVGAFKKRQGAGIAELTENVQKDIIIIIVFTLLGVIIGWAVQAGQGAGGSVKPTYVPK
ncbi:hypothetical protein EQG49_00200 [Periweissella cryptocerci]|uniref:Uncharacterized protein n=1 Tax=Periweissella cryptocerci TaxID=2506420 RepID=A0A4V1AIC0_9LACO|nr:hypothetical protein [Periweissella cryptocerci]QBO34975.1 hypothetical protein EQG49_00200 [Periweissella cryptocerci]